MTVGSLRDPNWDVARMAELCATEPLTSIEFGGRAYPVGTLTPTALEDLQAHGLRIVAHSQSGAALQPGDLDATRQLQWLLKCADPDFALTPEMRKQLTPQIIETACLETVRQIFVAELGRYEGSA